MANGEHIENKTYYFDRQGNLLNKGTGMSSTGGVNDADIKAASDLIGHWESVAFKGKGISKGVEKITIDFLPNNKLLATRLDNGKTYSEQDSYTVNGNHLICTDDQSPPDSTDYSLIGDHLVLNFRNGQAEVVLQRLPP